MKRFASFCSILSAASLCAPAAGAAPETNPTPAEGTTAPAEEAPAPAGEQAAAPEPEFTFYVTEYLVRGSKLLSPLEVERAVYPYLGPERTIKDVEAAGAALEKAFKDKGWQAVQVEIPNQDPSSGVILLNVLENRVGRLRVRGSRYFSIGEIKRAAPSMAEGMPVDFNNVTKDIIALNQWADRAVTPELKPGVDPGTVDIDLVVKDSLPLHGSIELNNRYSPDTSELRLNTSLSYTNLWQRGHSAGVSFQVAPEDPEDAKVFSAWYLARLRSVRWMNILLQGTKQDSNVSTLGGVAVAGRGDILGARAVISLPSTEKFYHSLSIGADYKHFKEDITLGQDEFNTPITYYPVSANYSALWTGKGNSTEFNAGANFHFRGTGSDASEFDAKRYRTDGNYLYFRGDLAHTRDLPAGFQVYGKVQGQAASKPLLNSEQFAGGGLGSARGYLESAALGDNGIFGTFEFRSPSLVAEGTDKARELRVYGFVDGGRLTLNDPLPDQDDTFDLISVGVGTRVKVFRKFNGSLDVGWPLRDVTSQPDDPLLTFRLWAEF